MRVVGDDDATVLPALSAELQLAFADVADMAREGLLAMSVAVGLRVMNEMMQAEVTDRVGPKHAKLPDRTASRHSAAPGSVVLGGRRVPVSRPRARSTDGAEVQLDSYATFSNDDLLTEVVMERMLAGLPRAGTARRRAGRRAGDRRGDLDVALGGVPPVQAATTKALGELMARDLSELRVAAMMIDGVFFAEQCCVVALAICADGTKVPVGLWLGDTENKTVVTSLLADLSAAGWTPPAGSCSCSTGPRRSPPGCARCSATTR